jgi:ABC-type amino acid transport substrate-binding protein
VSLLELAKTAEGVTVIPFTSTKWSQEFTAMAFRKEDESLRNEVNRIIAEMKDDGTLAALQEKWFGQSFVDILPNEAPTW